MMSNPRSRKLETSNEDDNYIVAEMLKAAGQSCQLVNLPGARPLMKPLVGKEKKTFCKIST